MPNSNNGTTNPGDSAAALPAAPEEVHGSLPVVMPPTPVALAPRGAASTALSSTPNAACLLKALRRRWLAAATLGILVAAVTAAAIWFFLPPGKHTGYIKLYMPLRPEGVLYAHPEGGTDFASFARTQFALMKSRLVLNTALRDPKVRALNLEAVTKTISPVEWLEKEIRIEVPDGPELPRVTMVGDDPEQLKVLVTAVVDAYLNEVVEKQRAHRQLHIDQLKDIASKYEDRLKRIQKARNELVKAIGSGDNHVIALKQELATKQLGLAQGELIRTDADLRRMELQAKIYQSTDNANIEIPEKLVDLYIDKDLAKEVALRADLEARLAKDRAVVDDENNPTIRRLRDELDKKNKFLEEQRKKLRASYRADLLEKAQKGAKDELASLNQQIAYNKEFKRLLNEEIERLEKEARVINDRAINLDGSRIDIQQAEAGVARVMSEIDRLTVELPAPPRVSQLEEVIVTTPDETTRRLRMAGIGAGGGFVAVLLLIALLEFRSRRLDSPDEVVRGLGLELMGTLPAAPRRFGGRLMRSTAADAASWQAMLAESVDSARTLLLRAAGAGARRAVMVTSATSGEGKTSLATHLAASLARAGYKTLLVDGDLRKPAVHRIFDLPQGPGFCELLRGQVTVAEAIRPAPAQGLWLLPAGQCDGAVLQLLGRDATDAVLGRLKQEFDFVVLDSSPVLPVADALLLAQHVDGVLLSLLHGVSRLPKVYAAFQRLSMLRVQLLGVVMNGAEDEVHGYGRVYAAV